MLISCSECKHDVSDQATSCPHCGHPIQKSDTAVNANSDQAKLARSAAVKKSPVLAILATIALAMTLTTPRFLIFFPLMVTFGLGIGSFIRKEKGRPWVALVLLGAIGIFVLSNIDPATLRAAAPEHTVTYSVEGTASTVSLTYNNNQGGTEQETVTVPWTRNITAKDGDFLYISAQNQDESGDVVVRIIVDGQEIKHSNSSGRYSIASASGSCCTGN